MDDKKNPDESSSSWGWPKSWDEAWNGESGAFFAIGITFLIIGIGTPAFIAIGIVFMVLAFSFNGNPKDNQSEPAEPNSNPEDEERSHE